MDERRGQGWLVFSGIILMLAGLNLFLNGLWAFNANERVESAFQDTLLFSDSNLDVWGWIYVVIGVVVIAAGIAVMGRAQWARWLGVIAASIGAISAFFWLFNPNFWVSSLVAVVLNVLVIYGLVSYGERDDSVVV
jgi:hypothetical protein